MSDFTIYQCASNFALLTPVSEEAQDWVDANIEPGYVGLGDAIAVETRYLGDVLEGIQSDGLTTSR